MRSLAAVAAVAIAVALGACGGDDKPAYCQDRTDLENSIKGLGDVNVRQEGVSAIRSQLQKVESDARALVSSAQGDFPSETDAISKSLAQLKTSVGELPSSPNLQQVAAIGVQVQGVVTAVNDFIDTTDSNC